MTPDSLNESVPGQPEERDWWIPAPAASQAAGSGEAAVQGREAQGAEAGSAGPGTQPLVLRVAAVARVGLLGAACAVVAGAFAVAAHQSEAPTQGGLLGASTPTPSRAPLGSPTAGPDRFDPWSQPLLKPASPPVATPPGSPVLAVARPGATAVVRGAPPAPTTRSTVSVRSTPASVGTRRGHQVAGVPVSVNQAPVRKSTGCHGAAPACTGTGPAAHWPQPPGGPRPPHPPSHLPHLGKPPGPATKPASGPPHPHPVPPHLGAVSAWPVQAFSSGLSHGPLPGGDQG